MSQRGLLDNVEAQRLAAKVSMAKDLHEMWAPVAALTENQPGDHPAHLLKDRLDWAFRAIWSDLERDLRQYFTEDGQPTEKRAGRSLT
jgi:hypothetical protein